MSDKGKDDVLLFCAKCFATEEGGSWGDGAVEIAADEGTQTHCYNCGAGNYCVKLPRWAVESIYEQASWVGKRYYPHKEDKEARKELIALRALAPDDPERTARLWEDDAPDESGSFNYWVEQPGTDGTILSVSVRAKTAKEALRKAKTKMPYRPERFADDFQGQIETGGDDG